MAAILGRLAIPATRPTADRLVPIRPTPEAHPRAIPASQAAVSILPARAIPALAIHRRPALVIRMPVVAATTRAIRRRRAVATIGRPAIRWDRRVVMPVMIRAGTDRLSDTADRRLEEALPPAEAPRQHSKREGRQREWRERVRGRTALNVLT